MEKPYIVGIGGANLDICGRTNEPMLLRDSNIGSIHLSAGGVCRNICENAVRMGGDVRLISAVGADANGQILLQECNAAGLNIDCVSVMEGYRTGSYLSIHGADGDMMTAINDMDIISCLTPDLLRRFSPMIERAAVIVVDANLPVETLKWICMTYGRKKPIFAEGETYYLDLSDIPYKRDRMRICRVSIDVYHSIGESDSCEKQKIEYIIIDDEGKMDFETEVNTLPATTIKTDDLMDIYSFFYLVMDEIGLNADTRTAYVEWDISDSEYETFVGENIPTEVEIPFYVTDEEVEDYLSDKYGYCVESYTIDNE